jgi:S1-C subfamily serine protease
MTDNESSAASPSDAQQHPPGSLGWKILVASAAFRFFGLIHEPEICEVIGQPDQAGKAGAWPVAYFSKYLQARGLAGGGLRAMLRILLAMEEAGFLLRAGWDSRMHGVPVQGQLYIAQGMTSVQMKGNLWLSEVIGPELVIQSYNVVTVQLSGGEGRPTGTGLVLDRNHIVTNRHVLAGLVGGRVSSDTVFEIHPAFKAPGGQWLSRSSVARAHHEVDVAVIEGQFEENVGMIELPGMAFRDPRWDDDVRVFGFPSVLGTVEQPITVEHGDVVNPSAVAPAIGGFPRHKIFLTSAIERPGNSGGPIVAQDGRVVGLVVDHTMSGASGTGADHAGGDGTPPFYRGIPASEVVRAIEELGFTGLARIEEAGTD